MVSVASAVRPLTDFQVARVPVGKAVALTAFMGLGDAVKGVVAAKVPAPAGLPAGTVQLITGFGLAWVVANVKPVRNLLGDELATLAALGIVADTINDQLRIQDRAANLVGGLFGGTVVSHSPPQFTRGGGRAPTGNRSGGSDIYAAALGG